LSLILPLTGCGQAAGMVSFLLRGPGTIVYYRPVMEGPGMPTASIEVRTSSRCEMVDITRQVRAAVRDSGAKAGLCVVYVPHTTAAITINEHADPDVARDITRTLSSLVPHRGDYAHGEGNSDAHIKASLTGNSRVIPVDGGAPILGTWEGVFLCEFDGPRSRRVHVTVIADK
jgi:secondary thiamine-phosphate synthase enzyme